MSATSLVPAPGMSLYALSEELMCLLDTAPMVEGGTIEREDLDRAIARFQEALPRKVDDVGRMFAHLEHLISFAKQEIDRIQARKKAFEAAIERLESYCVAVLEKLPEPKKGARKLEGEHFTLSIRPSEAAIITNEEAVPAEYKTTVLELPANIWQMMIERYPQMAEIVEKKSIRIRLCDVKKALKSGASIAGADLEFRNNLVRK